MNFRNIKLEKSILFFLFLLFNFCTDKNPTQPEIDIFNGKVTILDAEDHGYGIPYVKVTINDSVFYSDSVGVFYLNGVEDNSNMSLQLEHEYYNPIKVKLNLYLTSAIKFYMNNKIPKAERELALSYFPLAPGNYWEYLEAKNGWNYDYFYNDTLRYSVTVVKETLYNNEAAYWEVDKTDIYSSSKRGISDFRINEVNSTPQKFFIRVDKSTGLIYRFKNGEFPSDEKVIYSAFSKIGDSYSGILPSFNISDSTNSFIFENRVKTWRVVDLTAKIFSEQGLNSYFEMGEGIGYVYRWLRSDTSYWNQEVEVLTKFNINN